MSDSRMARKTVIVLPPPGMPMRETRARTAVISGTETVIARGGGPHQPVWRHVSTALGNRFPGSAS